MDVTVVFLSVDVTVVTVVDGVVLLVVVSVVVVMVVVVVVTSVVVAVLAVGGEVSLNEMAPFKSVVLSQAVLKSLQRPSGKNEMLWHADVYLHELRHSARLLASPDEPFRYISPYLGLHFLL